MTLIRLFSLLCDRRLDLHRGPDPHLLRRALGMCGHLIECRERDRSQGRVPLVVALALRRGALALVCLLPLRRADGWRAWPIGIGRCGEGVLVSAYWCGAGAGVNGGASQCAERTARPGQAAWQAAPRCGPVRATYSTCPPATRRVYGVRNKVTTHAVSQSVSYPRPTATTRHARAYRHSESAVHWACWLSVHT